MSDSGKIYWSGLRDGERVRGVLAIDEYPSGEPMVKSPRNIPHIDRIMLRPRTMRDLMGGLFFIDSLSGTGDHLELILPFVPGARQDRRATEKNTDFLFTARSIAMELNMRRLQSVHIWDPHSDVMPALIDRCVVHRVVPDNLPNGFDAVISPDAGAEKRASVVAKHLGVPLVHGWKTRDMSTGKLAGFGVEPFQVDGAHVLVVDDICDGGGTFIGLAQTLKAAGDVTMELFVTHGLFTQGTDRLHEFYKRIITTDSVEPADRANVEILTVCKEHFMREED